jgi:hypothetical protein
MRPSRVTRAISSAPSVIEVTMTRLASSVTSARDGTAYSIERTVSVASSSATNSLTSRRGSNRNVAPITMNRPNATSSHQGAIAPTSINGYSANRKTARIATVSVRLPSPRTKR